MSFKFLQAKKMFDKSQESNHLEEQEKQAEFLFELEHELLHRNWMYLGGDYFENLQCLSTETGYGWLDGSGSSGYHSRFYPKSTWHGLSHDDSLCRSFLCLHVG